MSEWNVEEALARLRAISTNGGRKLSFHDQCAAFAAMYGGAAEIDVARAFDISMTTASNISGCLEQDPTPWRRDLVYDREQNTVVEVPISRDHDRTRNPNRSRRYERVAREFEALGEAEFNRRYLSKDVFNRIAAAHNERRAGRPRNPHIKPKDFTDMSSLEIQAWRDDRPEENR